MAQAVKVIKCNCNHDYQDKVYGKGMRVHNYAEKAETYKCTVCGDKKKSK